MDFLNNLTDEEKAQAEKVLNGYKTQIQALSDEKEKILSKSNQVLDEKKKLQQKFEGVDLDKWNQINQDETINKNREVFDKYGWEGVKKELTDQIGNQFKDSLNEKDTKYTDLEKQKLEIESKYQNMQTQNEVSEAMSKVEGVSQKASKPMKYIVQEEFERDENGKLVTKDKKVGADGNRMGVAEWLSKKETMQNHPYLYEGKSGAGISGGEGQGEGTKMSTEEFNAVYSKLNPQEKMEFLDKMEKEGRI